MLRASPPPMFRSRTLDRLTRVHPAVPALLFCPLIVVLLLHALQRMPAYDALLEVLAGWILWTLTEYWVDPRCSTSSPNEVSASDCTG